MTPPVTHCDPENVFHNVHDFTQKRIEKLLAQKGGDNLRRILALYNTGAVAVWWDRGRLRWAPLGAPSSPSVTSK